MAPDRGSPPHSDDDVTWTDDDDAALAHETSRSVAQEPIGQEPDESFLATRSEQPQFTLRALFVGLVIGVLIAFSNTYFGLQTGWISGMAMPSALIGFAYFKGLRALMCRLGEPMERWGWGAGFSEVENVLVQTVAGSVGTMPLGCGFVGVVPALEYLLKPEETPGSDSQDAGMLSALKAAEETGGLKLPLGKLILWALGLCFFGVMFAVPLRKEVIVREKLRFPSGTATALMIGVLHGGEKSGAEGEAGRSEGRRRASAHGDQEGEESQALMGDASPAARQSTDRYREDCEARGGDEAQKRDWQKQIRLLTFSFAGSAAYVRAIACNLVNANQILIRYYIDPNLIFHPPDTLHSHSRQPSRQHLALDPQPLARLHWPRHHHGSSHHHPYASRRPSGLGRPVTNRQIQGLGVWGCGRLEHRLQGMDRVDQPGDHAGGCDRQPGLAHSEASDLVYPYVRAGHCEAH